MSGQHLVILDRDGVINEDADDYIKSVEEWRPIAGSLDAIARLTQAGFLVFVASNQSGLARGLFDEIALANIHAYMCASAEEAGGRIDAIFYCPHAPEDDCQCRKPRPGLLQQMEEEFQLSVAGCYFVGDTLKDVDAALAMDCQPVLVRTGKGADTEQRLAQTGMPNVPVVDDLVAAVDFILG